MFYLFSSNIFHTYYRQLGECEGLLGADVLVGT